MKLSNLYNIPPKDWTMKEIQEAEPDIKYILHHTASTEHYFVIQKDGSPEHHFVPSGYMIFTCIYPPIHIIFESFDDLPKWAKDEWERITGLSSPSWTELSKP